MKNVVMLATVHQYQITGNDLNSELEKRLAYLRSKFNVQAVMEEWSEKFGESVSHGFAARSGLHWANVGTPAEPRFRTYSGVINYPGHNGTLRWDPHAPPMDEYGPFENQEARENWMAKNVHAAMENYDTGLFILGIGHMHSLFGKLLSAGFKVTGYSWLGPA